MLDSYGREISYLRMSVTELCNLRCRYCMPADGICKKAHENMLTEDEMAQAVRAAAALGIKKLRVTGGEPLVKKNIVSICRRCAETDGIRELCITTNGVLLPALAKPLREAGVSRVNLSLDTLDEAKFKYITRIGTLSQTMDGLHAALEAAQCGMFLFHNGTVRRTVTAMGRENAEGTAPVSGMYFSYDAEKVDAAIKKTRAMPGIYYVRVWLNEGRLELGDDIMLVLADGDIRPHVIDALQSLVGEIKQHCVVEKEIY